MYILYLFRFFFKKKNFFLKFSFIIKNYLFIFFFNNVVILLVLKMVLYINVHVLTVSNIYNLTLDIQDQYIKLDGHPSFQISS